MPIKRKILRMIGIIIIIFALLMNPFFILKQPPSIVEIENLFYIKVIIIVLEFLFLSVGLLCFCRPERVLAQLKCLNPLYLHRVKKKECALSVISIVFCLVALEVFSRLLFAKANGLPLGYSKEEMIYPALHQIEKKYTAEGTNILLLGGSVLFINAKKLQEAGRKHALRFYNAANIAHTSLDSVYKYNYLTRKNMKFDYVIFYHGINEVRLNNIPTQFYQDDYSHYYYYKITNHAFNQNKKSFNLFLNSTLGYNLYHLWCKIYSLTIFRKEEFVPYDIPVPELTKYGHVIKTENSFRNNLQKIVNIANAQKAILIVPFFAFQPAYVDTALTNIWGDPPNVVKGINGHNTVIAEMQSQFITINTSSISADRSNFEDICHFTEQGQELFGGLIIKTILQQPIKKANQ